MAETNLYSVANRIIRRLEEVEKLRWTGLDVSLQRVKDTISNIQRVLLDEEKKHKDDFRDWLGKIGDLLYDADDLLDEYYNIETSGQIRSVNKMTKLVRTVFISTSNLSNRILGHRLKVVMEKLAHISAVATIREVRLKEEFDGVDEIDATELTIPTVGQLISMDGYRDTIIKRLFENKNDDVSVQAVCGAEGSGKSELAWSVFNSEIVRKNFQLRMWVELAPEESSSDLRLVIKKIINSAAPPHKQIKRGHHGMEQLQKRLHDEIQGKGFSSYSAE